MIKNNQFTQEQLEEAFKKVQNKEHWKNKIDSFCLSEDMPVVNEAIRHFTATEAEFTAQGNGWMRVKALGYRLGPAGDR